MITLDEDLVERYDNSQHDQIHNFISNKVKDGIRENAIVPLCELM